MTTMIAAVAVVAVVLVAGAFVILNNDDDGTKNAAIASQLQTAVTPTMTIPSTARIWIL